jgi:hypothetical protein
MTKNFPELNITPDDEKKMENLLGRVQEILQEDEQKMEGLVIKAKEILERATEESKNQENAKAFAEIQPINEELLENREDISEAEIEEMNDIGKAAADLYKEIVNEILNEKGDVLTNVEKNSLNELFHKVLIEELPELGLSIEEKATDFKGRILKDMVAVKATPYKTDREFILNLWLNPAIEALSLPQRWNVERFEKELEENGILPKGTVKRALAREYKNYIKRYGDRDGFWQKALSELGNIDPLTDEEAKELMRKIIRQEYMKRFESD